MNAQHCAAILTKVKATPRAFVEAARLQNAQGLAALLDLSAVWAGAEASTLMDLGIVDMFLSHLRSDKAPRLTNIPRGWQRDADFAYLSIMSLGRMELLIDQPRYQSQVHMVLRAWPGIFKWTSYIYDARIASESAQDRRMYLDGLVMLLYVFSRFDKFILPMLDTKGCVELVTKLWLLEDIPAGVESIILGAAPTATLGLLLKIADALEKGDSMHRRILSTTGGDAIAIAKPLLRRLKKATQAINPQQTALDISWYIELITGLCGSQHPFRRVLFDLGVIPIVTSSFVALSHIIVENPTRECTSMFVACVDFFSRFLEGDDYLALAPAIKAGFLAAFLDFTPALSHIPAETVEVTLDLMRNVIPRYLVYRSFIETVESAMERLKTPHYRALRKAPLMKEIWATFITLFKKRRAYLQKAYDAKDGGSKAVCDNVKCQKTDLKSKLKQCAACKVVYYCSPDCQKKEWKASHKNMCPALKEEFSGHRDKGRPKTDIAFGHALAGSDADKNFAVFHDLADRDFPDIPRSDLLLVIDYTKMPEEYSVKIIKPGFFNHPGVTFSAEDAALGEARFLAYINQMRANPDATLVQSLIPSGATVETLITPMARPHFWEDKNTYSSSDDSEDSDF
ncbi:hypothetical protein C8J57DRAFT_201522 [Mycena rebaudengoi]|nr:hypothetical protein C8J57DRAFT_201522 [Mycena rebaudengoi]